MSDQPEDQFPRWKLALVIESIPVMIGLVMPITPSKTGSKFSPAAWLFGEASYWMDALIWIVITNIMLGILLVIALIMVRK
jgi:hypothetical protein